jgi:DNA-binding MarR family transcriptional regulator
LKFFNTFISKLIKIKNNASFTLQQLRILKAVATEKNFTAAEILYLSQPSLSKQIKTLEKTLIHY